MKVLDIVWGRIDIEPEYIPIIKSKEFNDTKNKSQLGLNVNSNSTHSRYQHLIGTYHVACTLIKCFLDILKIYFDESDIKAIKCMALVHDVGHACFSHSSEHYLKESHEENTVAILLDPDTQIHQAIVSSLGEEVLQKVVDLIEMKPKIKENKALDNRFGLMLFIGKLLSGGIDIDRIDYIARDSRYLTGDNTNFLSILEGINVDYIGDSLEVVFDESVEYDIAKFFNTRFELYDRYYFGTETRLIETIYGKFIENAGIVLTWNTTEIAMRDYFRKLLNDNDIAVRRYANLLYYGNLDDDVIVKEIYDRSKFDFFKKRIVSAVPELEDYLDCVVYTSESHISIYNKKNKIYINKGGVIQDISKCSKILNSELSKEKYAIGIDIFLLRQLLENDKIPESEIESIIARVRKIMSNEIEQEKKYTFSEDCDPKEKFKIIRERLGLTNPQFEKCLDTYYDDSVSSLNSMGINVRKRIKEDGTIEWTIKRPVKDQTSINKRDEKNFSSLEEAMQFLKVEWGITVSELQVSCVLRTLRAEYKLKCYGSEFEVSFDKSTPLSGDSVYAPSYMIECELKSGNSSGLYFLNEIMRSYAFLNECNLSKKEIAINTIQSSTPVSNANDNDMDNFKRILEKR